MNRRWLLALAGSSLAFLALGAASRADEYRITGPVVHENLGIYLVHGKSAPGPVPLTLDEALRRSAVKVHETGNVNELQIENLGGEEVFVQSGDIVKGGKQDRVLTVSLVLPPRSGRIPIASFCVEQGRWAARGKEEVKTFATASAVVPSREAKLAMKAPLPVAQPDPTPTGGHARAAFAAETGTRQHAVWDKVRKVQQGLSSNLGVSVNAAASQTSLQLALEHEKLKDAQAGYLAALEPAGEQNDVVGYAFAINGRLNSAEVYPSNGLFRKMWPKLVQASITEAIGQRHAGGEPTPSGEAARAFLNAAQEGKSRETPLAASVRLETRDAEKSLFFETRRANGSWAHRSYLAK